MNSLDFEEYIQDNFNVASPDELSEHDRILAFERIKVEMLMANYSADNYMDSVMKLMDYLGV